MSGAMGRIAIRWAAVAAAALYLGAVLAAALLANAARLARAQDMPGIELCTRESRLDRRTGCLQSNVEFLQQVVAKNAREAQQRLSAAERDIAALQAQLAAANRDLAALKDALAALQGRLDQLGRTGPPPRPTQQAPGR